jgi:hypothetical protein
MKIQSLVLAVVVSMPLSSALAQTAAPKSTDEARAAVKLPGSAEEHLAMAQDYEQKAAEWRKEAALHRDMAEAYAASHPDQKGGVRNAEAVKMEKHCMAIVKDAEKLAADAEWSVKYHRTRAKEMGH